MRWLWVLLLGLTVQGAMGQEWAVQVTTPKEGALFGWAQSAPEVAIRAELRRQGEKVVPKQGDVQRLFLTAQIFSGERLLDNVPLWDDGTHGDERSGDGVYAASYRPPQAGAFRLRVRAQADILSGNKTVTREFWSGFLPFRVIAIPYARITQPETGSEIKGKTTFRARLLVLEKPFEERDETLKASVKVEGEGWRKELPLNRKGSLLTANINFPKRGTYRLVVMVRVQRDGKTLNSESEIVEVRVIKLGYFWLAAAASLFLIFLALPPKEPPLRYRHYLRFEGREIILEPGEKKQEIDLEFEAAFDEREVRIRQLSGEKPNLKRQDNPIPQRELELREKKLCWVGEERLVYEKAEPMRERPKIWHRLLPTTFWRCLFFALALLALACWLWQWYQFAG
jgi:hypothetical protein